MHKRPLGRSGLSVAPLCLGGNVFGWTTDEETSFALLDAFTAEGFGFVDTADKYSDWVPGHAGGESEAIIGRWMKARGARGRITLATKVGMSTRRPGLKAANILAACEASLQRLGTDHIDLYYAHIDDPETPVEETLEAFGRLIAAGKVRAIGASNFTATRLSEGLRASAGGLPRYEVLQPEYNLVSREFETELQPLCLVQELAVCPFYGLAGGFLSGKYRSEADAAGKARARTVGRYMTPGNFALLDRLDAVAKARGAAMSEVAIAWLRDRPAVAAPIASATSLEQLASLIRGARLELTAEETAALG